ncbi:hypothetical protein GOP47_0031139 [Adiantum capillus-veneris]|nr:hypothetical protein GOP47_0031139 [Adiantum capillus-veneris]
MDKTAEARKRRGMEGPNGARPVRFLKVRETPQGELRSVVRRGRCDAVHSGRRASEHGQRRSVGWEASGAEEGARMRKNWSKARAFSFTKLGEGQ